MRLKIFYDLGNASHLVETMELKVDPEFDVAHNCISFQIVLEKILQCGQSQIVLEKWKKKSWMEQCRSTYEMGIHQKTTCAKIGSEPYGSY